MKGSDPLPGASRAVCDESVVTSLTLRTLRLPGLKPERDPKGEADFLCGVFSLASGPCRFIFPYFQSRQVEMKLMIAILIKMNFNNHFGVQFS